VTDIVEIGPTDPTPDSGEIVYAVGPTVGRRLLDFVTMPAALALTALVVALATLTVTEPATELADVHSIASRGSSLEPYRWAGGARMIVALLAVLIALEGARRLAGSRPKVRVQVGDLQDDRTIDELEAAAIAEVPVSPAWAVTMVGASLVVAVISLAINAAIFGYAMASHTPPPTSTGLNGF
jgi:hypothetical protein